MQEFKGTPGPWRVISSGVHVVAKDGNSGSVVVLRTAKLGAIGDEPQQCIDRWEADAKLAAAAPELLEALQEADKTLCVLQVNVADANKSEPRWDGVWDEIQKQRDAIKRARDKALNTNATER